MNIQINRYAGMKHKATAIAPKAYNRLHATTQRMRMNGENISFAIGPHLQRH